MLKTINNDDNKKPLRIGIDGRVLQEKHISGIPFYANCIIQEIIKKDKKNKYIIFYNSFRKIDDAIPHFEGNVENRIFHFPNKILEWLWKFFPYPKIDKILNVDIFFSPHFLNIPLSGKVKRILTIHDLSFIKNKKYFSWKKNIWHWQMSPKKACRQADKIIAVSQSTKKDIIKFYNIKQDKIKVIYNGYRPLTDFYDDKFAKNVLDRFQIKKNGYILFLATLEPRKNIEGIIDAFSLIEKNQNGIKLLIAGKKGWLFDNIFRRTKKYGLEKKIIFTDFINEEEKYILFQNAALFVFPSFCEGFGLPVLEAKNHHLPIITSANSSIPEIIKDGAILINPHNTNDLAKGMAEILNNKKVRKIISDKQELLKVFDWEFAAAETLKYLLS